MVVTTGDTLVGDLTMKTIMITCRIFLFTAFSSCWLLSQPAANVTDPAILLKQRQERLSKELKTLTARREAVEAALAHAENSAEDPKRLAERWHALCDEEQQALRDEIADFRDEIQKLEKALPDKTQQNTGEETGKKEGPEWTEEQKQVQKRIDDLEKRIKDRKHRLQSLERARPGTAVTLAQDSKGTLDRWRRLCREEEDRLRREARRVYDQVDQLEQKRASLLKSVSIPEDPQATAEVTRAENEAVTAGKKAERAGHTVSEGIRDWTRLCGKGTVSLKAKEDEVLEEIKELEQVAKVVDLAQQETLNAEQPDAVEDYPTLYADLRKIAADLQDRANPQFMRALKACIDESDRIGDEVRKCRQEIMQVENDRAESAVQEGKQPRPESLPPARAFLHEELEVLQAGIKDLGTRSESTFRTLRGKLDSEQDQLKKELQDTRGELTDGEQEQSLIAQAVVELRRARESNAPSRITVLIPAQIRRLRVLGDSRESGLEKELKNLETKAKQLDVRQRTTASKLAKAKKKQEQLNAAVRKARKDGDGKAETRLDKELADEEKSTAKVTKELKDLEEEQAENIATWRQLCEDESKRLIGKDKDLEAITRELAKDEKDLKEDVKEAQANRNQSEETRLQGKISQLEDTISMLSTRTKADMANWEESCRLEEKRLLELSTDLEEEIDSLRGQLKVIRDSIDELRRGMGAKSVRAVTASASGILRPLNALLPPWQDSALINEITSSSKELTRLDATAEEQQEKADERVEIAVRETQKQEDQRQNARDDTQRIRSEAAKLDKIIDTLRREARTWERKSRDFELIIVPNRTDHYIQTTFSQMRREETLQPVYDGETVGDRIRNTLGGGEALRISDSILQARRPEDEDYREPVKVLWALWEENRESAGEVSFAELGRKLLTEIRQREQRVRQDVQTVEAELDQLARQKGKQGKDTPPKQEPGH